MSFLCTWMGKPKIFKKAHIAYISIVLCFGLSRVVDAVRQHGRRDFRTSQEKDFRLITTSKNNLSEIHISWPTL